MGVISPIATNPDGSVRQTGSLQQLGKDDFLRLLVAKLQNQDPMNPMEDSDFIAQLAQFSTLEQMNNIANGISESTRLSFLQTQSLNNVMATGLIGREIKADYSGVYIGDENEPKIAYTNVEFAASMEIIVKDANGLVIRRIELTDIEAGSHTVVWDGKDAQGNRVDIGYYSIEATAKTAGGEGFIPALSLIGVVESVFYRDGGAFLRVNGVEVALGDILAIGEPGSFDEENQD